MSRDREDSQKPRKLDKSKHHRRGYSENVSESRAARVSFKRYLQQVEEESLLDFEEDPAGDE